MLSLLQKELADIFPAPIRGASLVRELSCSVTRYAWPLESKHSVEISNHYRRALRANPRLYNDTILLARGWGIRLGQFRAEFFQTDFASYLYWRKHASEDRRVVNCSPAAIIISQDEQFLLATTSSLEGNSTKLCLPGGMPEPRDMQGSRLDLQDTLFRELAEELGVAKSQVSLLPGWYIVAGTSWIVVLKPMKCSIDAHVLSIQIRKYIARQRNPELIDVLFRPLSSDWGNTIVRH